MTNYWLVGASWGGVDHQDNRFLKEGVWELGWEDGALCPGRGPENKN